MDGNELLHYGILFLVGMVSGFLNTVAGGGSLLSIPVLIFMGLPGTVANCTNRVAIFMQTVFAVKGFRDKGIELPVPYAYYLSLLSLAGAILGAQWALSVSDVLFNKILAVVMVLAALMMYFQHRAERSVHSREKISKTRQILGAVIFFFLGIYGGFLQAGIGFLVVLTLYNIHHFTLVKTNYIKVFTAVLYTGASVIIFILEDKIAWMIGIILALGHAIGGWYASRWSVDKGDKWIKRILLATMIVFALKIWNF